MTSVQKPLLWSHQGTALGRMPPQLQQMSIPTSGVESRLSVTSLTIGLCISGLRVAIMTGRPAEGNAFLFTEKCHDLVS